MYVFTLDWSFPLQIRYYLFCDWSALDKIIPTWRTPLQLHNDRGTHFTGQVLQKVCAVWPVLQHFHCTYHPQSSGLVKHTNSIIKTQLAKLVEALQIPWSKALLLVLLNRRPTSFGTFTPFEAVTGCPVHLAPASSDPQLIKREILQYCKGLIASIKNNHVLVSNLFRVHSWEMKTLNITPCNLEISSIGKDTSRRTLFNLAGKPAIRYC